LAFLDGVVCPTLLQAIDNRFRRLAKPPKQLAVGLSGGPDSAMLAVHAQYWAQQNGITLQALHIHHGLQKPADAWRAHSHSLARQIGLACHSLRVQVPVDSGLGTEAAARVARYNGLAYLADQLGLQHVLL